MLILPQSRSAVGSFLIGFFILLPVTLLFLEYLRRPGFLSYKFVFLQFIILSMIVVFLMTINFLIENFSYLTGQFIRLLEGKGIGRSGNIRIEQFLFALDKANHPLILLFGNGPAKSELEYVESIHNYQFYRYGLTGLLLYFLVPICCGIFYSWNILRAIGHRHPLYPLFLCVFIWYLLISALSIGNNFTEQVRLSFFFYSTLGMLASVNATFSSSG